jgi:DNA polymerase V
LRRPTDDSVALVNAAVKGIQSIYRPGFNFSKAGVMLLDLQDGSIKQRELDLEQEPSARGQLMGALDKLNDRYGRGTVTMASAGTRGPQREFEMKRNLLTPQYTTCWQDLPVAKA